MNERHRSRRLGVGLLFLSLLLAACSTAAAPSASPPTGSPSPDASVTAPPSQPAPSDASLDPGGIGGDAKLVIPKPGQLDVRDVPADELAAHVEGSTIVVTVTWTSGVEPCNILDHVVVTKGDGSYAITLREGHGPQDVVCIAIAELHKTEIAIPDVALGTYEITDSTGGADPIEVTVG